MSKEMYRTDTLSLATHHGNTTHLLLSPKSNPKLHSAQSRMPLGANQAASTVLPTCLPLHSQARPGKNSWSTRDCGTP